MNILAFDIETIPDINAGQRLLALKNLDDAEVAEALFAHQREKTGRDFLPHHLHQIVAISVVLRQHDQIKVWSLGTEDSLESELIQRFFDGIERYCPTLVSWNGSGFDLPVLHYRALLHHINASRYWEMGEHDNNFRWNNYQSRYHQRHTDLMDVLAMYQARASIGLDNLASLLGFPGKMGMSGANVWQQYQKNQLSAIRNYCETDVLNTYLIYLRYQLMRAHLTPDQLTQEEQLLRDTLLTTGKPHLRDFVKLWPVVEKN